MKKRILPTLLILTLCLGLLPAVALAAETGTLSPSEAESRYGISVSPSYLDLGSCFVGEALSSVITITNNGSHTVDVGYRGGFESDNDAVRISPSQTYFDDLAPGESREYTVDVNTRNPSSGTATVEARLLLDGKTAYDFSDGFAVGKSGNAVNISDILTVDYEVKPLSAVSQGDIDWDVSVKSIDFGTSDVSDAYARTSQEKTFTVTNRGSLAFTLEGEIDDSLCSREGVFSMNIRGDSVRPGESVTVAVWTHSLRQDAGVVEGCTLNLTAYYPDSREDNTITTSIPLSIKYLYNGGYVIVNKSDNSYGTVKTSDGIDRDRYGGNSDFTAKEGSSVTFVMTPYDPTAYHVSDIKLNGVSMGIGDLVNNTYTISDIRDNYKFEAVFSPGADPNPQQPQQPQQPVTGVNEPAPWAKFLVDMAIAEGLLPNELQSAYDQPITRREFCLLADALYTVVKGNPAPVDAAVTFTDTTDPAVLRMASAKVVNGVGEGAFDPDGQLTREQAATMLSRLSAALGKPLVDSEPTFDDSGSVSGWAKTAVGQMETSGIMSGTGENQFSPQRTYTREQSIVTIVRMYMLLNE